MALLLESVPPFKEDGAVTIEPTFIAIETAEMNGCTNIKQDLAHLVKSEPQPEEDGTESSMQCKNTNKDLAQHVKSEPLFQEHGAESSIQPTLVFDCTLGMPSCLENEERRNDLIRKLSEFHEAHTHIRVFAFTHKIDERTGKILGATVYEAEDTTEEKLVRMFDRALNPNEFSSKRYASLWQFLSPGTSDHQVKINLEKKRLHRGDGQIFVSGDAVRQITEGIQDRVDCYPHIFLVTRQGGRVNLYNPPLYLSPFGLATTSNFDKAKETVNPMVKESLKKAKLTVAFFPDRPNVEVVSWAKSVFDYPNLLGFLALRADDNNSPLKMITLNTPASLEDQLLCIVSAELETEDSKLTKRIDNSRSVKLLNLEKVRWEITTCGLDTTELKMIHEMDWINIKWKKAMQQLKKERRRNKKLCGTMALIMKDIPRLRLRTREARSLHGKGKRIFCN